LEKQEIKETFRRRTASVKIEQYRFKKQKKPDEACRTPNGVKVFSLKNRKKWNVKKSREKSPSKPCQSKQLHTFGYINIILVYDKVRSK
jgi:hypothetical protein